MGLDPQALLRLKHKIIKAVVGQQLFWENNPLLTELLEPLRGAIIPRRCDRKGGRSHRYGWSFSSPFAWNMDSVA